NSFKQYNQNTIEIVDYADKQEAELRRQMEGTGVEVQRQGDDIKLIMPGNITFATDSANIAPSFYAPLN
ncbi:hypothetical protein ACLBVR_39205, partial [Pseudomonas aeruginosa]